MRAWFVLTLALVTSLAAHGEPLAREDVPEPLRAWVDWALHGHEAETCPLLLGGVARSCVWPGRLALSLDAQGGTFEQEVFVAAESEAPLPGGGGPWPEDVRADGLAASAVTRGERPVLRLSRGSHRVSGRFVWSALPPGLRVPAEVGIVDLTLNGERVPRPRRDTEGSLWLQDAGAAPAAGPATNRVEVEVHRRLEDGVPVRLTTVMRLRVSGEAREELLGVALPRAMTPTAISAPLPARLEADGRLRVQVRPGEWTLRIEARQAERSESFGPEPQARGARWDDAEIWAVALAPQLRLVEIEGAPAVDPTLTEMPAGWRGLPAYRLEPGSALRFVEKRRGNEGSAADRLELRRVWHLDFDGGGATVADHIQGTLRSALRLEMGEGTALGRAAIAGVDQPITQRAGGERLGIEVALGALALEADSRVPGGARRLPAVGWAHDVDALSATLMVPPGYRLLHATGVDEASTTWISRWDLLSVFFVLLIGVAAWRLFGTSSAILALAALALCWPEEGAPKLVWLALAIAEALRRVARGGRIARLIAAAHLIIGVLLVAIAVPFAIRHLRAGLFPALERPWERAEGFLATRGLEPGILPAAAPPEEMGRVAEDVARESLKRADERRELPVSLPAIADASARAKLGPDPSATVPTGPGRPDWSWETVELTWSGPVTRDQQLGLWLLPPAANALLAIARVLLIVALARVFVRAWRGAPRAEPGPPGAPPTSQGVAAALALVAALAAPVRAHADLPSAEMLETLRTRLLEAPACAPNCAALSTLALGVTPERLDLRAVVDAAAESGVPLPGGGAREGAWAPSAVHLDGEPASALRRDGRGTLWLRVPRGRHEVRLAGTLPPQTSVEIALPLAPRRVSLTTRPAGWAVVGIQADGTASGALQLVREARATAPTASARIEPTAIPPFVQLRRALELGLSWRARTTVQRIAPEEAPIVVEVPLLAGESVTTPGIRIEKASALVTIPAGQSAVAYEATLAVAERIALAAPEEAPYVETWTVTAGPLWHVEAEGIPPVDEVREGERALEWAPWPGEQLTLRVERPASYAGPTLTFDRSQLALGPGLRATDATLSLALRSSQGGQHSVTLPENAALTSLVVDGVPQPLRQEDRRVPLALTPGSRELTLGWREARGVRALLRGSEVDLAAQSVNAHVEIAVPSNRWVLFVGGPRLGPSVLFWPALAIVGGLAWLLGRLAFTPLRAREWLLLGVGLTQAPLVAAGVVVAWFLLVGLRGAHADAFRRVLHPVSFGICQVLLVLLTAVAAGALIYAIQHGLLGTPEMRIAGNGSDSFTLRWYLDRSGSLLPTPWVFSLSIWWYRAAMLGWSLWLSLSLIRWSPWAFAQWSAGGWIRPAASESP